MKTFLERIFILRGWAKAYESLSIFATFLEKNHIGMFTEPFGNPDFETPYNRTDGSVCTKWTVIM